MLKFNSQELSPREKSTLKKFNHLESALMKKISKLNKKYAKADKIRNELNLYLAKVKTDKENYEKKILNTTYAGQFDFIKSQIPEFPGYGPNNPFNWDEGTGVADYSMVDFSKIEQDCPSFVELETKDIKTKELDKIEKDINLVQEVESEDEPIDLKWDTILENCKEHGNNKAMEYSILGYWHKKEDFMKSIYESVKDNSAVWDRPSDEIYYSNCIDTKRLDEEFEKVNNLYETDKIKDTNLNAIIVNAIDDEDKQVLYKKNSSGTLIIEEDDKELSPEVYVELKRTKLNHKNISFDVETEALMDKYSEEYKYKDINLWQDLIMDNFDKANAHISPRTEQVNKKENIDLSGINIVDNTNNKF